MKKKAIWVTFKNNYIGCVSEQKILGKNTMGQWHCFRHFSGCRRMFRPLGQLRCLFRAYRLQYGVLKEF